MKKLFKRADVILIAALLAAGFAGFGIFKLINTGAAAYVLVTVEDREYARLRLDENAEISIASTGGVNLLCVENGEAYIKSADCSNQVCVDSGHISSPGEVIVCLPHRVIVSIEEE